MREEHKAKLERMEDHISEEENESGSEYSEGSDSYHSELESSEEERGSDREACDDVEMNQ